MIGFGKLRERFQKAISSHSLSHAHIIVGPDGIGKSALVEGIAREILGFGDRNSVDIVRVRPEKTIITVNQVREVVVEASLRPYEGMHKIIIFYEADKMGQEAQNALLKTIEEPMEGIFFFLLAENDMTITETIKSRCHLHKLLPLDQEEMNRYLDTFEKRHNREEEERMERETAQQRVDGKTKVSPVKKIHLKEQEKLQVISMARGLPGKAEEIVLAGMKDLQLTDAFLLLKALVDTRKGRSRRYFKVLEFVPVLSGKDLGDVFDDFTYAVDCVLKKKSLDDDSILEDTLKGDIDELSRELTFTTLEKYLDILYDMRKYILQGININKETIVSSLLLKLTEV